MTNLSVNLNKIALIRNSRGRDFPSVEEFARLALDSGAHGVTVHPRPDQRHATYEDVRRLATVIADYPDRELNIEGYPTPDFLDVVVGTKPTQCTLVPDAPGQLTSDHGWDLTGSIELLGPVVASLAQAGVRTSVFVDHDVEDYPVARELGVDRVELYTEAYAQAFGGPEQAPVLAAYASAAARARAAGLGVNAGHDLNLDNLGAFLGIEGVLEVSIGHALTVEALGRGFADTVRAYVDIVESR